MLLLQVISFMIFSVLLATALSKVQERLQLHSARNRQSNVATQRVLGRAAAVPCNTNCVNGGERSFSASKALPTNIDIVITAVPCNINGVNGRLVP